jgi:enoyl-CoA hydratase/carnithine racemase
LEPAEAERIGLLDWVAPQGQLDVKVRGVVVTVLKGSQTAPAFSKKLVTRAFDSEFNDSSSLCLEFQRSHLESDVHRRAMAEYRVHKQPRRLRDRGLDS